eukprot:SAG11_NODE_35160_length_268_cov_0.609467_1_plen_31_part_10
MLTVKNHGKGLNYVKNHGKTSSTALAAIAEL